MLILREQMHLLALCVFGLCDYIGSSYTSFCDQIAFFVYENFAVRIWYIFNICKFWRKHISIWINVVKRFLIFYVNDLIDPCEKRHVPK